MPLRTRRLPRCVCFGGEDGAHAPLPRRDPCSTLRLVMRLGVRLLLSCVLLRTHALQLLRTHALHSGRGTGAGGGVFRQLRPWRCADEPMAAAVDTLDVERLGVLQARCKVVLPLELLDDCVTCVTLTIKAQAVLREDRTHIEALARAGSGHARTLPARRRGRRQTYGARSWRELGG